MLEDRCVEINIIRRYNSKEEKTGLMGKGWFFEFESNVKKKMMRLLLHTLMVILKDLKIQVHHLKT